MQKKLGRDAFVFRIELLYCNLFAQSFNVLYNAYVYFLKKTITL